MTLIEKIAEIESKLRGTVLKLPSFAVIAIYSNSRKLFLKQLVRDTNFKNIVLSKDSSVKAWGLEFQSPIFNAAGMFKNGEGYELACKQGAGAFLAGTTTNLLREGNRKGIAIHPFISYHSSNAASNWMGLPNEGHQAIAKKLAQIEKQQNCPLGASIAGDSGISENEMLAGLLNGFELYQAANVDFIELNESCPNVVGHSPKSSNFLDAALIARLVYISDKFLKKRKRNLPVVVKFSNDTLPDLAPALIDLLLDLGFDGINFGNTSTNYELYRRKIHKADLKNYDYFTENISGGLSGDILKRKSLELSSKSAKYMASKTLSKEFHIIRTGGISTAYDLEESKSNGVMLNQWFSGYFSNFALHGHSLYAEMTKRVISF